MSKRMRRVYVAGPYNATTAIGVLNNIRAGIQASAQLFAAGYAPFCPHLDYHFVLEMGDEIPVEMYYDYSMAWLEASDVVALLPGWRASPGCCAEALRAQDLGIPVMSLEEVFSLPNRKVV
jgi:hypothetical protein